MCVGMCVCMYACMYVCITYIYEGESKSKGKIHLTALIEATVGNFTYYST